MSRNARLMRGGRRPSPAGLVERGDESADLDPLASCLRCRRLVAAVRFHGGRTALVVPTLSDRLAYRDMLVAAGAERRGAPRQAFGIVAAGPHECQGVPGGV